MALRVSPPARRVFAAMVFGGGVPRFDWQRTTETGEGVAQFRCSGNRCFWWQLESLAVQEDLAEKNGVVSPRHPPKCGTKILIVSVRSRSHDSCFLWVPSSEPEDENASGGKISIRAGGAR